LRRSDSYGITEPSDCKDFVAGADISFLDSDDRKVTTLSYPALAGKLLADDIMPEGIPLAQSGGGWQAVVGKGMHALGLRQFAARAYRVIDEKSAADKAAADTASAAAAAAATAAAEAARLAGRRTAGVHLRDWVCPEEEHAGPADDPRLAHPEPRTRHQGLAREVRRSAPLAGGGV
jgi:hypothetical protein